MNKKIKFAIIGLILAVLILVIINFPSTTLPHMKIIKPPSAIIKVDGKEQISGIGSYCWNEVSSSLCADYMGIPTSDEPLPVSSPFTVHLSLPLKEPPQELQINVIRVTDNDKIKSRLNGSLLWQVRGENLYKGNYSNLTPESESDINLSLEPGLFVLKVYPSWKEKGSVSYGFLVEVRANDTGTAPATPVSPVNQTPPSNMTASPAITVIQPDAGRIGTKVVITGTSFTARDNNIVFRLAPEDSNTTFKVGYINHLISRDGKTIEFVIPEGLGACAFPLPETIPVTACPLIGISFKPGTQTYPVFVVNQNGTSNGVNFTVSR